MTLDAYVDAATFDLSADREARQVTPTDRPWKVADLGPFSLLDVSVTCNADRRELCLAVVNRSPNEDVPTRIDLGPHLLIRDVRAYEVNGADTSVHNSFAQPHAVSVQTRRLHAASEYTFPAHSVTLLRGQTS